MSRYQVCKTCKCGKTYDVLEWMDLPFHGTKVSSKPPFELRNCECGVELELQLLPNGFVDWRAALHRETDEGTMGNMHDLPERTCDPED